MQPELNESDFEAKTAQGKVLVEFFATWCPHCQAQQPVTDQIASLMAGQVKVYQVDVDKCKDLAAKYAPDGFPTYVLFENGQAVAAHVGEWPLDSLEMWIKAN